MLQNKQQDNRHNIRLPKQASIPVLKQIDSLQVQAQANTGRTVELPFGEPPEEYILTVFRDRAKGDWLWMLYRGEGSDSFLEWSYVTPDAGVIHNVISAQFPGSSLRTNVLPDSESPSYDNYETQSTTGGLPRLPQSAQTAYELAAQAQTGDLREKQSSTGGLSPLSKIQRATLEGELENLSVPNVLQSIAMGKMTGRLEISSRVDVASVHFFEGAPLHAVMRGAEGDAAIVELIGWTSGAFRFYPEPKTTIETVKKRLDWLVMEGAAFSDQEKFLNARGLTLESVVMRKHSNLTESQFEQMASKGACTDMKLLKAFYQAVDSKSTLVEVLRRRPLAKVEWVPLLYTLVSCDLLNFSANAPEISKPQLPGVPEINWSSVRTFEKCMLRQDTDLYTYPAFLYFVEKEFHRFERFQQPFSIIIIEIGMRSPQNILNVDPLPLRAVKEVAKRIDRLKRKTDLLGHYETFALALLLPLTDSKSARSFAAQLGDVIMNTSLTEDLDPTSIVLAIGWANIPEGCQDLASLLALARPSKA